MVWLVVVMVLVGSLALAGSSPHKELLEGEPACLHAPCQHGVCVATQDTHRGYRSDQHSFSQASILNFSIH
jgi:hypothetical protein